MGNRSAVEDEPTVSVVGSGKFPEQAGLPDSGLADDGHDLPLTGAGALTRLVQGGQLRCAAYDGREAPRRRGLEPRPGGTEAHEFVDLDRFVQAPHRESP